MHFGLAVGKLHTKVIDCDSLTVRHALLTFGASQKKLDAKLVQKPYTSEMGVS